MTRRTPRGTPKRQQTTLSGESEALSNLVTTVFRLFDWLTNFKMGEDLADKVDDFICAWDKVVGTDIDPLVVLILGKKYHHLAKN